jgi:hypothetical protein
MVIAVVRGFSAATFGFGFDFGFAISAVSVSAWDLSGSTSKLASFYRKYSISPA